MNAVGGRCLNSAMVRPRSTSLADAYMSVRIIERIIEAILAMLASALEMELKVVRRMMNGNALIGIKVTTRDAMCQSFCSV